MIGEINSPGCDLPHSANARNADDIGGFGSSLPVDIRIGEDAMMRLNATRTAIRPPDGIPFRT